MRVLPAVPDMRRDRPMTEPLATTPGEQQEHVWFCINVHVAPGYPPFGPCGCPIAPTTDRTEEAP